jgi:hypothetical protein
MTARPLLQLVSVLAICSVALAGRPLATDDAAPLDCGALPVEAGLGYRQDSECRHWDIPLSLTYGLLPRLEVGVGFGGQFEDRDRHEHNETIVEEALSDLSVGFKWKLFDQEKAILDQAIAASVKVPTATHSDGLGTGRFDYDVTYIMTRQIGETCCALLNVGYTWVGDRADEDFSDNFHYGPALTWQATPKMQGVAEIVFSTPAEGGKTSAGANVGVIYQLTESLAMDAAIGTKVAADWPDFTAALGLTWAIGPAN